MLKGLKLSYKIGLGFVVVLAITLVMGIIAAIGMSSASSTTARLSKQSVPVQDAVQVVSGYLSNVMYNMRAYTLSEDKNYLQKAKSDLTALNKAVEELVKLGTSNKELIVLNETIPKIKDQLTQYTNLVDQTEKQDDKLDISRKKIDDATVIYMKNACDYLKNEEAKLEGEVNGGAPKDKILERYGKTKTMNDLINLGNGIQNNNFRYQAIQDEKYYIETINSFGQINEIVASTKKITTQEINLNQLDAIKAASEGNRLAMEDFHKDYLEYKTNGEIRGKTGDALVELITAISTSSLKDVKDSSGQASSLLSTMLIVIILGVAISIVFGAFIALAVVKSIATPMVIAVQGLAESSQQLSAASEELSSASQQLSEGSTEQAASIEETSSTLEESSSMVRQNAENAKHASSLAAQAKSSADKGTFQMKDMLTSMSEIKKSSDEISKIIKVIDEIAFQTNILSLNAAVEAARAGEAGLGFAVVAEEVRNLAQRSAQAAKDTASIIEKNIELSQKGVEDAKKVGEVLGDITVQVKKVNELIDEVAAASQEQSQGISQINKAMSQMEKVTQLNAASAQESASASQQLSAQAMTLDDIVLDFRGMIDGTRNGEGIKSTKVDTRFSKGHSGSSFKKKNMIRSSAYAYTAASRMNDHEVSRKRKPEEVIPLEQDMNDF